MQSKENNETRKVFIEQLLDGRTLGRTFSSTEIVQNVYGMLAAVRLSSAVGWYTNFNKFNFSFHRVAKPPR